MLKAAFVVYAVLVAGAALLSFRCPPTNPDACWNSVVAVLVLSVPWCLVLEYVWAIFFYVWAFLGVPTDRTILGLWWAGVVVNVVVLYRFAFSAGEAERSRRGEAPPPGQ